MMDIDLVRAYMTKFFGYGRFGAKYWFVGLEEGGVTELSQFADRLQAWNDLGQPELADIRQHHAKIGGTNWFRPGAPLQRTWRALIRTRYAAESPEEVDTATLKRYQIEKFAGADGDVALLELLPLPARGRKPTEPWFYDTLGIPELSSREQYVKITAPARRAAIIRLIDEHGPGAVITYGEANDWRHSLNANEPLNAKAWTTRRGSTVIICTHTRKALDRTNIGKQSGDTSRRRPVSPGNAPRCAMRAPARRDDEPACPAAGRYCRGGDSSRARSRTLP